MKTLVVGSVFVLLCPAPGHGQLRNEPAAESLRSSDVDGRWGKVFAMADPRWRHTAIYDPVGDRMVVFGGDGGGNDTWALFLGGTPVWHRLVPTGTPPPALSGHAAIYDPVRRRMIVTGDHTTNRVWALSLSGIPTWSELPTPGKRPVPRAGATAVYDPVRDRMVFFGGDCNPGPYLNDLWALSLSGDPTWTELSVTTGATWPPIRYRHSAIYDPLRDRMVVFGGHRTWDSNDTWELTLSGSVTWRPLSPSGTPPPAQSGHSAIYDAPRDRMVVFGGHDAWSLSFVGTPTWSSLNPSGSPPPARICQSGIFDPVRSQMVIFGGYPTSNDVWGLSLSGAASWEQIQPQGFPPPGLAGHSAILDPVRDEIVTFGGEHDRYVYLNETWTFSFYELPVWRQLVPAGTPPPERHSHTAIYDPARDRMIVFGGGNGSAQLHDTWVLSLGGPAWEEMVTAGPLPGVRSSHTAILDPVRDRMVVFGGRWGDSGSWVLSLAGTPTWSVLEVDGTLPPPLRAHVAVYDPVRDRMLVFGGAIAPGHPVNDTWALSFGGTPAWTHLDPVGEWPPAQAGYEAIYDSVRDRMVIFGAEALDPMETWALRLQSEPVWDRLDPSGTPPSRRAGFVAVHEPERDAMWIFGGSFYGTPPFDDSWELAWSSSESDEGPAETRPLRQPDRGTLAVGVSPNPLRGGALISFRAPAGDRTTVQAFDVLGRLVARIHEGAASGEVQQVTWQAAGLPSGLYFVRLEAGAEVTTTKVTLVQ